MARKSRKNINIENTDSRSKANEKKNGLLTAAYIRLSVENNGHETDDSLQNQIALVESFVRNHDDLILTETFIDNGYSGASFDRPEFVRMIDAVKSGKIQCIVVKDLSRFGRDYLETGYYIETIFPLLNVRFLAITDNFDSTRESDMSSISVPVKNIVNAMYAKDYSRKQEVFREMCKKTARVMGINAPYGYKFSKETKRLEIDEVVAPYVRMLFAWALLDVPRIEIAKRLNTIGAPPPGIYDGRNVTNAWKDSSVKQILYNPAYAGFHVMGKSKISLYKGIDATRNPRNEWLYFPDFHEAYITIDDYQKIEKIIVENKEEIEERLAVRKNVREQMPDCFPKMVYCADCGRAMNFCRGSHHRGYNDLSFCYYRCRYSKEYAKCSNKKIQQNYLKIIVMDQLRLLIQATVDRSRLLTDIQSGVVTNAAVVNMKKNIRRLTENEKKYQEKQLQAYMDFADKLLDEDEYQMIKERLNNSEADAKSRREKMEKRFEQMEMAVEQYRKFSSNIEQYLGVMEFNEEMVKQLVSRIMVSDDGTIELELKCKDVFDDPLIHEYLGEMTESEVL